MHNSIHSQTYIVKKRWDQLLFWFNFTMAFPFLLLFNQNLSVYIFISLLFFTIMYKKGAVFTLRKGLQLTALFFAIGAIASTFNIPSDTPIDSMDKALSVLPNYLYWSLLIIFMITHRQLLDLKVIYKGIFWGINATIVYYLFLQNFFSNFSLFNGASPNGFAFVLICYSPIAIYYLMKKKGKIWALVFLIFILLILLQEGRRAGFGLVFVGGLAVIYTVRINWKNILMLVTVIISIVLILQMPTTKTTIYNSSYRIYNMLYETENVASKDPSFLTRVAMVRKAKAIYEKHPYTGIGLNNFTNYEISYDKNFKGAKYVVNKRSILNTSSHNSYAAVIAEGGLLLFVPFIILISSGVYYSIFKYFRMKNDVRPIYVGFIAMAIHFYFITAIVNVYAWFLIGLATAYSYRQN